MTKKEVEQKLLDAIGKAADAGDAASANQLASALYAVWPLGAATGGSTDEQPIPASIEMYYELLNAVARDYPHESRHQTALRYIRNAERPSRVDVDDLRLQLAHTQTALSDLYHAVEQGQQGMPLTVCMEEASRWIGGRHAVPSIA